MTRVRKSLKPKFKGNEQVQAGKIKKLEDWKIEKLKDSERHILSIFQSCNAINRTFRGVGRVMSG
jgi:hypothetical protein